MRKLRVHEGICWSVSWNDSGSALASCGQDRRIFLLDSSDWRISKQCVSKSPEDIHNRTIRRVTWRADGKLLAVVSFDSTVSIWRVTPDLGLEFVTKLSGQENEVKGVCFSPCGEMLATCSRDKSIWIFDVSDLLSAEGEVAADDIECLAVLAGHSQDVKCVKFNPLDSRMLVSVSYDDTVKIWRSTTSDDWELSETLRGHSGTVWDVAFDPNTGSEFATVSADGSMKIWAPSSSSNRGKRSPIPAASLYLVTGLLRGSTKNNMFEPVSDGWSCQTIQLTSSPVDSVLPPPPVYAIDWSVDNLIATACGDNTVRVFLRKESNGSTSPITTVKMESEPNSVSFSPNGRDLAIGLDDGTVCIMSISDSQIFG